MNDESIGIIPVCIDNFGKRHFLLVLHTTGHWAFPKGHQDKGESLVNTALRELYEETGLEDVTVDDQKEFTEHYSFKKDGMIYNKTVRYFIGFSSKKKIHITNQFKDEIKEAKWLKFPKALKTLTYDEAKSLLKEANQYLESKG